MMKMTMTRGAALGLTALASVVMYAFAAWMFVADFPVPGWVMIATGLLGWLTFLGAVGADLRASRGT
jgi:hypothetical protein